MNTSQVLRQICGAIIVCCTVATSAQAGLTDISTDPMVTGGTSVIAKPNVMFMLDDSGSMDWDYMPDNAKNFAGKYGFNSNQCNGVFYDPAFNYPLPVKSDGTTYPNATFTAAWRDGYNTGSGTVNLNTNFTGGSGTGASGYTSYTGPAYYYTYTGAQNTEAQQNILNTSSTYYQECNSAIGSTPGSAVFTLSRLASVPTTTITVSGSSGSGNATITITAASSARVSSITVSGTGGGQIMSGRSSSSSTTSTVASNIASTINNCTSSATGNCTVSGYSATVSGSTITINGPAASAATLTLVLYTSSSSMTYTQTNFPTISGTTVSSITVNGVQLLSANATGTTTTGLATDIKNKISATGYSATVASNVVTITAPTSASTYTPNIPVSGITCTPTPCMSLTTKAFPESTPAKLQNFANWYSYYSTRMQTMKSGVGLAFSAITDNKRVGFMTMNNNVSPDIVDIADFSGGCTVGSGTCQKDKWYTKLYASNPGNSTPLREALSHVGQLYAHKFGNVTTYKATITVGGSGSTSVDSITVGGVELMNDSSVIPATTTSQVASNINDQINAMVVTDYGSTVSGNVITIYGPPSAYTPIVRAPVVSNDGGGMTFTATSFTSTTTTASLNGITPADPMQYSCQQNYVILSTDGYWNGSTTYQLNNTTVGQQDGLEPRPLNDGYTLATKTTTQITQSTSRDSQGTQHLQTQTSTLQQQTTQLQKKTDQLQSLTSQLQTQTSTLQVSTSPLMASTSPLMASTSPLMASTSPLFASTKTLQSTTKTLQGTVSKVLMSCAHSSSTCGTAPANGIATTNWIPNTACIPSSSTPKNQCAVVVPSSTLVQNVTTKCNTGATISGSSSYTSSNTDGGYVYSSCTYTAGTPTTVSTCTYQNPSATPNNTTQLTATQCAYTGGWSAATSTSSCTYQSAASATTDGTTYKTGSICSYGSWTTPATAASCTYLNQTTATTDGTAYQASPKQCSYGSWTTPATAASCTYQNQTTATADTTVYQASPKQCSYAAWTTPTNTASSCTPSGQTTATADTTVYNASTKKCPYSVWSGWTNIASCTVAAQSGSSPYSIYTASQCQYVPGSWVNASSCTVVAASAGPTNYTVQNPVQCQYSLGGWFGANSCTAVTASAGPTSYSVQNPVQCQAVVTSNYANVPSCNATTTPDASGYTSQCQYADGAWVNTATCAPVSKSVTPNYTTATSVQCQTPPPTFVYVAPGTCTASTSGGQTISCNTDLTGPTAVASCTAISPTSGNSYTTTTCNTTVLGPTPVASCTAAAASSSNSYTATSCTPAGPGTSNTLADVAEYYYVTDLRDQSLGNCTAADGHTNVCSNNVPSSDQDPAKYQHLTTFTLGLGARGRMTGADSYTTLTTACDPAADGDFCSVLKGATANGSTICSWQSANTICNWPTPSSGAIENIDDLWHAAVNGRGYYFSARNSSSLAASLTTALTSIEARTGASAAAATSNPNASLGDNFVFNSTFKSVDWTGELVRQQIDLSSGAVSVATDWKAQGALDTLAAASANGGSRNIYTFNPSATTYGGDMGSLNSNYLKSFTYANLTVAQKAYFGAGYISGLTQFCASGSYCLSSADQTTAAGSNLVNFLRGDRSNEGPLSDLTTYYHVRAHILGDIVNAKVAYVKQAQYTYGDTNYSNFVAAKTSRPGMVYAAANDGMLHAINAGGTTVTPGDGAGDEAWAYIPSLVLPNLYKLADKNYATQHRYFVDGTPVTGDVCPSAPSLTCATNEWKTIMVGGMNLGGRGYYALDVTDPVNPKALWEFSDANMGYTFGNPQIAKLADGTWVVLVTSGYNNIPNADGAGGDGVGRLYVLNAYSGALIRTISTGVGSTTTPSGLGRISARVLDPTTDNTALEVYGGDMLGNVWRFDINNNVGSSSSNYEAQLLATLKDASGNVQPITTRPEVGIVSNQLVIFVGTGKLLGNTDLTDTQVQTMYALKDTLATTSVAATAIYSNPRAATCNVSPAFLSTNCFVQQTATNTICPVTAPSSICAQGLPVRTSTNNPVSFSTQSGWYVDLPDSGERDNTNPVLALGTLGFVSNTPKTGVACTVLGYSFRWFLDYRTGGAVSTSADGVISTQLDASHFGTDLVYVSLPTGAIVELTRTSEGSTVTSNVAIGSGGSGTRRTSWRELTQ